MGRGIRSLLVLLVILMLAPAAVGLWVYGAIQHRMNLDFKGTFVPTVLQPVFYLRNARFEWQDKVRFVSGTLKVEYDPLSLIRRNPIRLKLQGQNIEIEFLGDWAEIQGVENVTLDEFRVDFGVSPDGIREIYFLDAQSPVFQFHVEKSKK